EADAHQGVGCAVCRINTGEVGAGHTPSSSHPRHRLISSIGGVPQEPVTLSVDCGGGGIKASVLDAAGTMHATPVRTPTTYPLAPEKLIEVIAGLADQLPPTGRVTVGMPGMIRHGVVVHTPHYITRSGPRTKV